MGKLTGLTPLPEVLDYDFRDNKLLQAALTHSSYANEAKEKHSSTKAGVPG